MIKLYWYIGNANWTLVLNLKEIWNFSKRLMSSEASHFLASLKSTTSLGISHSSSTSTSSKQNHSRPRHPPSTARAWKLLVDPELVKLRNGFSSGQLLYRVDGTDPDVYIYFISSNLIPFHALFYLFITADYSIQIYSLIGQIGNTKRSQNKASESQWTRTQTLPEAC